MGFRLLWVAVFLSISCTETVVQQSQSSSRSHCDSSLNSLQSNQISNTQTSFSLVRDKGTRVGKVQLDAATIMLPLEERDFQHLLPNNIVRRHNGFSAHRVGRSQLAAVIDHSCTLNRGINSRTRHMKSRAPLSALLMTTDDDELQNYKNRIRKSTRAFAVPADTTLEELAQLAEDDPCIVVIGNNAQYRAFVPNDTLYAGTSITVPVSQKNAYLDDLNFAAAYAKFFEGGSAITTDVIIAVIDSGVKITHSDLDGNLWTNPGETAGNSVDDDGNGKVDDINGWNFASNIANPAPQAWGDGAEGHGTHVAGIIAAEGNNNSGVVGIISAHGKIMALNVFGSNEYATTTSIDNAITYAANKSARVINLSLGGETFSSTTQTAIGNAVAAGSFVVAAAGNGDSSGYGLVLDTSYGIYPASLAKDISGMMSVGSFDANTGNRSIFSNCSSTYVEISAPGAYNSSLVSNGGIPSTWHGTNPSADYSAKWSGSSIYGTSMATPMVSGAAALAISRYFDRKATLPTPAQVESILSSSAATSTALTPYVKSGKILDLNNLFDYIETL